MAQKQVFVGRELETARLNRFLDRALAGQGQVCFVTGGAGSGKTALVTEFARRAQMKYADLVVALGQCDAQTGMGDPYLPFREVLRLLTGDVEAKLAGNAVSGVNVRRLEQLARRSGRALVELGPDLIDVFVPGAGLLARVGTYVAERVGWIDELEQLAYQSDRDSRSAGEARQLDQARIFEQYTDVLKRLAEHQPLLLLLDDLQWIDRASVELLFHLTRRIGGHPILVIGTYRPNDVALGRNGGRHPLESVVNEVKRSFGDIEISLEARLDEEGLVAAYQFVSNYLDTVYTPHRLDEGFKRLIARRTGGQPLFVLELLRSLEEQGVLVRVPASSEDSDMAVWVQDRPVAFETLPTRVEAVIGERIARLEAELRELLTVASVEGEDFTAQVLARVREINERELARRLTQRLDRQHRLIREQGVVRVSQQWLGLYRFRHALFQKYLYNGLGEMERMLLHEDVGNALEALYADHTGEIAPQLARHFREAGVLDKAVQYLMVAAEQAARAYAGHEANDAYVEALGLLDELPDNEANRRLRADALLGLVAASYYFVPFNENLEILEAAAGLVKELGDARRLAQAYHWIGRIYNDQGNQAAAVEYFEKCLDAVAAYRGPLTQVEDTGDEELVALPINAIGRAHYVRAQYRQAIELLTRGIALVDRLGDQGEAAFSEGYLAMAHARVGEFAQALAHGESALRRAQASGSPIRIADAYLHLSSVYFDLGDWQKALEMGQQGLELSEQSDNTLCALVGYRWAGRAGFSMGDVELASQYLETSVQLAEFCGSQLHANRALAALSQAYVESGNLETGLAGFERALQGAAALGDRHTVGEIYWMLGEAYMRQTPPALDKAEEHLQQGLSIFQETGSKPYVARVHQSLGRLYAERGDTEQSRRHLNEATRLFQELGMNQDRSAAAGFQPG